MRRLRRIIPAATVRARRGRLLRVAGDVVSTFDQKRFGRARVESRVDTDRGWRWRMQQAVSADQAIETAARF